jgi:signal transduction histidine kinase
VIDVHSGKIAVESELNVGTTFRIHLPLSQHKSATSPDASP